MVVMKTTITECPPPPPPQPPPPPGPPPPPSPPPPPHSGPTGSLHFNPATATKFCQQVSAAFLGDATLSLWAAFENVNVGQDAMFGSDFTAGPQLKWIDNVFVNEMQTTWCGANANTSGTPPPKLIWFNLILTKNSATGDTNLYKDAGASLCTGNFAVDQTDSNPSFIGRNGSQRHTGWITDVRLYTSLLNAGQRTAVFNGGSPNFADSTVALPKWLWYKFLEGSGAVLTDSSGNGNDSAITDPTWDTSHP